MFGYIRPVHEELLVKEYGLYRAVYCGLCRYGGKHISHFTRFFLNYDFVALALLRLSLTDEKASVEFKRCPYHFKKRNTLCADGSYDLTCASFAILMYYKAVDDINDSKGFKRFFKKLIKPFFKYIKSRVKGYEDLDSYIKEKLLELQNFEKAKSGLIDEVADCFASIIEHIAAYGLKGEKQQIAAQCGYHIGRYIYLIDAVDDIYDDNKNGNYNPLIIKYGSVDQANIHIEEIKTTIIDSMNAFSSVYGLSTIGDDQNRTSGYDNIIFNMCELGGRAALNRVLHKISGGKR